MTAATTPAVDPATTTTAVAPKPWQQSLTVKGAAVAGAAALVLSYGPSLLGFAGLDAATANEAAKDVAGLLSGVGGLLALIGRMRLGGLH